MTDVRTKAAPYPPVDETAGCRQPGIDANLFLPITGGNVNRTERAKAICRDCPFKDPCLAYALSYRVEGTWGATSDKERDDIRREHGIKVKPLRLTGLVPHGPTKDNLVPHGTATGVESHRKRYTPLCDACAEFDEEQAS